MRDREQVGWAGGGVFAGRSGSQRLDSVSKILLCWTSTLALLACAGCSKEMSTAESTALGAVRKMGGLAVLDANGTHVATLMVTALTTSDINDRMDEAVSQIANFKHMTHLEITNSSLTDEHMKTIGSLKRINSLVISGTLVGAEGVKHAAQLPLESFYLSNTKITPEAMDEIGKIDTLKILDVSGSDVLTNPTPLKGLEQLEWLVAKRVKIDAAAVAVLGEMPALKRLSVDESPIEDADLERLRSTKPQLQIDGVQRDNSPENAASEQPDPSAE